MGTIPHMNLIIEPKHACSITLIPMSATDRGDITRFIHPPTTTAAFSSTCLFTHHLEQYNNNNWICLAFLPSITHSAFAIHSKNPPPPHDCNKCVIFTLPLLFPTGLSESHSPSNTPTMCVSKQVE